MDISRCQLWRERARGAREEKRDLGSNPIVPLNGCVSSWDLITSVDLSNELLVILDIMGFVRMQ